MHSHPRFWSNATDQRFRVADLSRQLVSRISGHRFKCLITGHINGQRGRRSGSSWKIVLDNHRSSRSFFAPLSYSDKRLLKRFLVLAKAGLKDLVPVAF
jgi:hypothetical protein